MGRNPYRIPILIKKLAAIWEKFPDIRLGQLICNLTTTGKDPFYEEDTDMMKSMDAWNSKVKTIEKKYPGEMPESGLTELS